MIFVYSLLISSQQCLGLHGSNRKKNEPTICSVSGDGLRTATSRKPAKFLVRTETPDLFGLEVDIARIITDSTSDISTDNIPLEFECIEENLHSVTYQPTQEGEYQMSIKWKGNHVTGSPFSVQVIENPEMEDHNEIVWKKMDE